MMLSHRLAERLDLSDQQRERIQDLMEERREKASRLLEEIGPSFQAQLDSMRVEIRALLDPSQREEFDRFQREGRELFGRGPGDRGAPGDPMR
jgi:hypothetical protein